MSGPLARTHEKLQAIRKLASDDSKNFQLLDRGGFLGDLFLPLVQRYGIDFGLMLDVMDLVCPALRNPLVATMMSPLEYLGHGAVGGMIGLALLGYGYFYKNHRIRQAGIAVLIALAVAGGVAAALKHTVPLPHPQLPSEYGLPSGRTSAAFALASTLSATFPGLSPVFFGLALLAGIARLYSRAHYIWSIIGGALIGVATGFAIALKLIPRGNSFQQNSLGLISWAGVSALGLAALAFFYSAENNIAAHLLAASAASPNRSVAANFDFGTAETRPSLRYGWSGDESWDGGKRSVVWANGLASELALSLPAAQDYDFRFNAFPYFTKGPACQRIEVRLNGLVVAKISLEPGWHWYQFGVSKTAVRAGSNSMQFFYDYTETPKSRGQSSDTRPLSVAFDILQALPKSSASPA